MNALTRRNALILDDFAPYTESLKNFMTGFALFDTIDCFINEHDLINYLREKESRSEVFLFLDYYLKEQTLPLILKRIKQVVNTPKVIVISSITNPVLIKDLLKFEPDGIVHKADKPYEIIECVEQIINHKSHYSSSIRKLLEKPVKKNVFTQRETELLSFWVRGYTVEQTSRILFLSQHTVISHRKKMFRKAKCHSIEQLLHFAKSAKLID